ncbi:MAG: hypothetical protein ABJA60_10025 [Nitrosospira sp.]
MAERSTFEQTYELADLLIAKATKEQLAECARVLALSLAHHQLRHGEVPVDQTLATLRMYEPTEEYLNLLVDGMTNLVGVLLSVCGSSGEARH